MTEKEFIAEVRKEILTIKKLATDEEKSRLDIKKFSPDFIHTCLYGLMTGHCHSARAKELYAKSLFFIAQEYHAEDIARNQGTTYTALEQYIMYVGAKTHRSIIDFIKGDEPELVFDTKFIVKEKKDTTYFPRKLSKKKALEYMKNNKGHFFTAIFTDKELKERTINCQYLKDQLDTGLGYVRVKEASKLKKGEDAIRNINIQTLLELHIAGIKYKL